MAAGDGRKGGEAGGQVKRLSAEPGILTPSGMGVCSVLVSPRTSF